MALETVVNIADLNATNPTSSDPKSQGDDHIRNLKTALLNDFAGFTGAVMVTGVDGGAVNAYTLTPANAVIAYGTKMAVVFAPTVTNTATSTINISGLGARYIYRVDGSAVIAGDLVVGSAYKLTYNGTAFLLQSVTKNYIDLIVAAEAATRAANDTTETNARIAADALLAPLASAALTGTPTSPTATAGTSTTQIATTAFVMGQAFSSVLPGQAGNAGKFVTTDGTTASWSQVYPAQTGNAGKYLSTDGTSATWAALASPTGSTIYMSNNFGGL